MAGQVHHLAAARRHHEVALGHARGGQLHAQLQQPRLRLDAPAGEEAERGGRGAGQQEGASGGGVHDGRRFCVGVCFGLAGWAWTWVGSCVDGMQTQTHAIAEEAEAVAGIAYASDNGSGDCGSNCGHSRVLNGPILIDFGVPKL